MRVLVVANTHANQDSLPLRFGIHFLSDTELDLSECKDLGTDDRFPDRQHVEARICNPNDPRGARHIGHFVLAKTSRPEGWKLITVWRNDVVTEFYLSEALRQLRHDGFLTSEMLVQMHPHFLKGEINSSATLIKFLSNTIANSDVQRMKLSEQKAIQKAEEALAELQKARAAADNAQADAELARGVAIEAIGAVEILTEANQLLFSESQQTQEELQRLTLENQALKEREQELLRKEEQRALQDKSVATLSLPNVLVRVDENVLVGESSFTVLTFGDGSMRSMKTIFFDRDGSITRKAHTLVGKRVRTTCWDPISEPGKWTRRGYFRNIYELE